MHKVKIYYFSGTGNTEQIVKRVRETFEEHNIMCELALIESTSNLQLEGVELLGLIFPVAIQSTFPNVWTFFEKLPNTKGQKVFMLDTMEYFSGGIVGPLKRLLVAKGYNCIGAKELKMHSSMNTKKYDAIKRRQKNDKALQLASQFTSDLLNGKTKWRRVPVLSDWMRSISKGKKIWVSMSKKKTIQHQLCIECKQCVKKCPVSALTLNHQIEVDHEKCISCMRCLHVCPKDAFLLNAKPLIK